MATEYLKRDLQNPSEVTPEYLKHDLQGHRWRIPCHVQSLSICRHFSQVIYTYDGKLHICKIILIKNLRQFLNSLIETMRGHQPKTPNKQTKKTSLTLSRSGGAYMPPLEYF